MTEQDRYPKISVITPSFNQGEYIEDTILSVIGQGYPNLEYIIIDGGSADDTVNVLKKYESYLTYWVSEKDDGQSAAINKGFALATGDILCWLNSDDMYLPGTLNYVSKNLEDISKPEILVGNCIHIKERTGVAIGSDVVSSHHRHNILWCDYILQPSAFWTRKVWQITGPLNEELNYALDWDWFIRAKIGKANFKVVERQLSVYRIHRAHKSSFGGEARVKELGDIYKKYHHERGQALYNLLNNTRIRAGIARRLDNLSYLYTRRSQGLNLASQKKPSMLVELLLSWIGFLGIRFIYPILSLRYSMQEIRDTQRML